jgi:phosphoribosylamine-glycine ligase
VVNPFSTGAYVAEELAKRTFKVIALWTRAISNAQRNSGINFRAFASIEEGVDLDETLAAVKDAAKNFRIVACICGGAEGSFLTDALSELLGVRTNGTEIRNRGSKKVQQEIIKEAGLRSIRQVTGQSLSDLNEFMVNEKYPVVVKPSEFVGSEGVKLCYNAEEARNHFNFLSSLFKKSGRDAFVICQEYLKGKEYIVDHVSRDGVHKTTSKYLVLSKYVFRLKLPVDVICLLPAFVQ